MAITEIGLLVNDICFLTIASYPRLVVQSRLWILLLGPAIDGLLGGFSTIVAAMHAYISDVTPDGSRATAFSRLGAAVMAGMAVGPVLGSALINATGSLLAPFYVSVSVHALWVILIRFLLPESLSSDSRDILKKRAKAAKAAARERDAAERAWELEGDSTPHEGDSSFSRLAAPVRGSRTGRRAVGFALRVGRRAILPLRPLGVFWPQRGEDGHKNYNLLLMGVLHFIIANMMGAVTVKANYTFWAFGWSPSQLGPYLSYMSVCRLIGLLVLLPRKSPPRPRSHQSSFAVSSRTSANRRLSTRTLRRRSVRRSSRMRRPAPARRPSRPCPSPRARHPSPSAPPSSTCGSFASASSSTWRATS